MKTPELRDYRCECGKLLFKAALLSGQIGIKCRACGKIVTSEHDSTGAPRRIYDWLFRLAACSKK